MNLTLLIRKFYNNHHNMFTNGLLMANILASAPTTIRIRIEEGDRPASIAVENINRAIKADACTISKTEPTDKIWSIKVLEHTGPRCFNKAIVSSMVMTIWKSKKKLLML